MKKKVLVVCLYRSRAVAQFQWVCFAGGCSVFLHAFSCLFRVADNCAVVFFFFVWSSCQFLSSSEKKRKEFKKMDILFWSLVRLNTTFERAVIRLQANDVPSTIHGKKGTVSGNTRSCYSQLWLLRVTGNCFWFLDRPACLERIDVLSQSPSAPRFLSRRATTCSSASRDPFLCW